MPNPLTPGVVDGVLVATDSSRVTVEGVPVRVRRGVTTAHPDSPVVAARPDIWRPLVLDFPAPAPVKKAAPAKKAAAKKAAPAATVDEG